MIHFVDQNDGIFVGSSQVVSVDVVFVALGGRGANKREHTLPSKDLISACGAGHSSRQNDGRAGYGSNRASGRLNRGCGGVVSNNNHVTCLNTVASRHRVGG